MRGDESEEVAKVWAGSSRYPPATPDSEVLQAGMSEEGEGVSVNISKSIRKNTGCRAENDEWGEGCPALTGWNRELRSFKLDNPER